MPISTRSVMLLVCCAYALSGCGWYLKGLNKQTLTLRQIHFLAHDTYSEIAIAIQRELQSYNIQQDSSAKLTLSVTGEQISRRTLSVNRAAIAAEYALSLTLPYSIAKQNSEPQKGQLKAQRVYDFATQDVVAKAEEEKRLLQEMRTELAQNLVRLANSLHNNKHKPQ